MEIETFNMLFATTKNGGYKLDGFNEDAHGFFYARWRTASVIGPEVKRRLPFNAALDAFLECKRVVEGSGVEAESDLFG